MLTYGEKGPYSVVLVQADDFQLFHTARTTCFFDKTEQEVPDINSMLANINAQGSAGYWRFKFDITQQSEAFFALLEETRPGYSGVAGMVDIYPHPQLKIPVVCGLHVMSTHRGKGLSQMLHDAATQYAIEETGFNEICAWIEDWNKPSIHSAERSGYVLDHKIGPRSQGTGFYMKDLRVQRRLQALPGDSYDMTLDNG